VISTLVRLRVLNTPPELVSERDRRSRFSVDREVEATVASFTRHHRCVETTSNAPEKPAGPAPPFTLLFRVEAKTEFHDKKPGAGGLLHGPIPHHSPPGGLDVSNGLSRRAVSSPAMSRPRKARHQRTSLLCARRTANSQGTMNNLTFANAKLPEIRDPSAGAGGAGI